MIIVTQYNKIESWSLVIANAIHNYSPSLLSAHLIYWQFAYIDKIKELIISQTHIEASNKQVIIAIWSGIDEKNPIVKPKDVYNKRAT